MAYSKTDPRHTMNVEKAPNRAVTKIKGAHSRGMSDRKSKPKMNLMTGKYCK